MQYCYGATLLHQKTGTIYTPSNGVCNHLFLHFICANLTDAHHCQVTLTSFFNYKNLNALICISLVFISSHIHWPICVSSLGTCPIISLAYFTIYCVIVSQICRRYLLHFFLPACYLSFNFGNGIS